MRHTIVALTRCSSAIASLGVLDGLQLFFQTPNGHIHIAKQRYSMVHYNYLDERQNNVVDP